MHPDNPDIFPWDSHFETGMPELDRQHRHLVDLVNSIGSILFLEKDIAHCRQSLLEIIESLSVYADFHFSREEELMPTALSSLEEAMHRRSHEEFRRYLEEARLEAGSAPCETAGKLLGFLSKWLIVHIIGMDMRMARKYLAIESALPRDEAHEVHFESKTNETLLNAMAKLLDRFAEKTNELFEISRSLRREIDAHKLTEYELHKFSNAVEHSPVSILITDDRGIFEYVNPKFTEMTGFAFHELDGHTPAILKSGLTPEWLYDDMREALAAGQEWRGEFRNRKKSGELYWDHVSISPIFDAAGKITHYVSIQENITERKQALEELSHQKEFSEVIINSLPGIFYMVDVKGGIVRTNPQFLEVTGYAESEIAGRNLFDLFDGRNRLAFSEKMNEVFEKGESALETEIVTKSGMSIPYFLTNHKMLIDGDHFLVGLGTDISERITLQHELVHQARTDMLTGLPNRRRFFELAELELARAKRYGGLVSIMMIDLDEFKSINDLHGHQTGDRVLMKFAETCKRTMRSIDIAGRLGGEEFAVLLPETDMTQAFEAAERLRQQLARESIEVSDSVLAFTASIGVATLSSGQDSLDSLLATADKALYEAKRSGRNRVFRA